LYQLRWLFSAENPWTPLSIAKRGLAGWIGANLTTTVLYFLLGAVVSRFFAAYGLFPAPIWLPTGIATVAAMMGGTRMLPGIFLGSFLTNDLLFAPPLVITTIISTTNALGPVIGALTLLRLRPKGGLFNSFGGIIAFLVCTTFLSPAISATGGAIAMAVVGHPFDPTLFYSIWVNWWLTDSGGTLYLAPALILWLGLETETEVRLGSLRNGFGRRDLAVWAWIAVVSAVLFLTPPLRGSYIRSAFPFLLVVPLSWIALRMSLRSAYTLVSLVAIVATAGTVAGFGPFQNHTLANPLQLVGTLVVLLAMNVLTIVSLVSERQEARNESNAKSVFLAETSHELRTPLNAIIGFSEMIRDGMMGPIDTRYRDYGSDIAGAGRHLQKVINDILDISKVESGRLELHEEVVSIEETLQECGRIILAMAKVANVTLDIEAHEAFPLLRFDPIRFRQILLNLMSNAVKFTPAGGHVGVSAAVTKDAIVIAVTDTGIGMRREDIAIALKPFQQIDSALSRRFDGTGLGLPLAKALTELHGGTLEIESAPGEGTTVRLRLPRERMIHIAA
jgi:signal transduction histidine kinase